MSTLRNITYKISVVYLSIFAVFLLLNLLFIFMNDPHIPVPFGSLTYEIPMFLLGLGSPVAIFFLFVGKSKSALAPSTALRYYVIALKLLLASFFLLYFGHPLFFILLSIFS